jgi:hypothetical protein
MVNDRMNNRSMRRVSFALVVGIAALAVPLLVVLVLITL